MDPVIPGQASPAASSGMPGVFTPGQVLSARVIEAVAANTYLVAVRGMTLVAASESPLAADSVVRLVVQAGGGEGPVRVALAPAAEAQSTSPAESPAASGDDPATVAARLGLPPGPISEQVVAAFQRQGAPLTPNVLRQAVRLLSAAAAQPAEDGAPAPRPEDFAELVESLSREAAAEPLPGGRPVTAANVPRAPSPSLLTVLSDGPQGASVADGQPSAIPLRGLPTLPGFPQPLAAGGSSAELPGPSAPRVEAAPVPSRPALPPAPGRLPAGVPPAPAVLPAAASHPGGSAPSRPLGGNAAVEAPNPAGVPSSALKASPTVPQEAPSPSPHGAAVTFPDRAPPGSVPRSSSMPPGSTVPRAAGGPLASVPQAESAPAQDVPAARSESMVDSTPSEPVPSRSAEGRSDPRAASRGPGTSARPSSVAVSPAGAPAPVEQANEGGEGIRPLPARPAPSTVARGAPPRASAVPGSGVSPVAPAEPMDSPPEAATGGRAVRPAMALPLGIPRVAAADVPPVTATGSTPSAKAGAGPVERSVVPPRAGLPNAPRTAADPPEVRVPSTRFQRTWSSAAPELSPAAVRAVAALPPRVALEAVARLAASPLPVVPATIPLAARAVSADLPRAAALLPERADPQGPLPARSQVDPAQAGPAAAIHAALRLAGIRPEAAGTAAADALGDAILLHRLVRLAAGLAPRSSGPADAASQPAAATSAHAPPATPGAAAAIRGQPLPQTAQDDAAVPAASAASAQALDVPRAADAATAAVREVVAQDLLPPKDLADYDRVLALPLADHGQPVPARLAVTTRRTATGGLACWMRVDCDLSRLGPVSVRLGSVDAGPVAITLFASPAAGAVLAAGLPALGEDLRALGVDAALRVVEEQP